VRTGLLRTGRRKVGAALAGVLIAGACLVAFDYGVKAFVARHGQEDLQRIAQRKMTLMEDRLTRLIEVLDDLLGRGVDSCEPADLDLLRQTALSIAVIKEISIVGAGGQGQCSTLGTLATPHSLISVQPLPTRPEILIEVIAGGSPRDNMLRLRRASDSGPGLAIMVLGSRVFSNRWDKTGSRDEGVSRAIMQDGTVIGEIGTPRIVSAADALSLTLLSDRYGIEVATTVSKANLYADAWWLRLLGTAIFGGLILLLLCISLLVPRRQRENPIAELEHALKAGEFVPYYQPIMDLVTGKLRGAEVLVRWRKADGSVVSPAAFVPLAESSGIIVDITRSLMRRVCDEIGPAFDQRPHLKVSFNLAARHFEDDNIVRDIRDIFGPGRVRLSQLVLEVTERQPIENLAETRHLIATLQGLGVRMALDDVGTGHSGLSYILKLGVDIIKIDKMFVDAIGIEHSSTAIIETLIDLAHNMRMDIIAEGVETFEQVVVLRDRGVRAAQGFVFAPPLPGASFLQLIDAVEPLAHAEAANAGSAPAAA